LDRKSQSAIALQRLNAELLERLDYFALEPRRVLDLGAGACSASLQLRQRFTNAQVIAADFAHAILLRAPRSLWPRSRFHRVAADAHRLPFVDHSVDLVYSNLLLPCCDQPQRVLGEVARVLKQGGLFVFSSLGPDTLSELRAAWGSAGDAAPARQPMNLPQLGDVLMYSGLTEPVMDTQQHRLFYPDVRTLMHELRSMGLRSADSTRSPGLTGRGKVQRLVDAYEASRTAEGIAATFEVIFGAAFGGGSPSEDHAASGEVVVPLTSIKKHVR
jgi:malonyl-CoA O-methyltransferase